MRTIVIRRVSGSGRLVPAGSVENLCRHPPLTHRLAVMTDGDWPTDPALLRTLAAAGLPAAGRFVPKAGWVSRVWVGDEYVVRLTKGQFRGAYRHEAEVVGLLVGSQVPHARQLAHGDGPDGPWYISERLPGRSLHEAWPAADLPTRQTIIESLGAALRELHRVAVPAGLLPPWLADALASDKPWPAFHPPVVSATLEQVEAARRLPGHDARLLADVADWIQERLPLFAADDLVLVHGDLHGSNVMVDQGRVTGLIDFAEALAQPADAELDTILRWCARAREFPPTPDGRGLDETTLTEAPGWLHGAYPELFEREQLRERLNFYDMYSELALHAHHPRPDVREAAQDRIARLLAGHNHLDRLTW
ncbi:phosphotransferase family protein [Kribbella sp. DT2]|uniref:phosphotransferase family protein n=1 Tax=Kribbella sp. DT2 TaxID=3393427 RepID=UPI003CFB167E